ncbi:MAG: hypothetical protein C6I01_05035, partial [Epsilonproteobacteria bacterium]|nr:hypothetical protein [Campylobacterota bacterium]
KRVNPIISLFPIEKSDRKDRKEERFRKDSDYFSNGRRFLRIQTISKGQKRGEGEEKKGETPSN